MQLSHEDCFQNKFYIESKLNRDLKQDLMNLFADHVAEKYVNTLMREYLALVCVTGTTSLQSVGNETALFPN